jgi:hypothetical protein
MVRAGGIDFALVSAGAAVTGLDQSPIARDREMLVTAPDFAATAGVAHRAPVQLARLGPLRVVVPGRANARRTRLDAYFAAQGIATPRPAPADAVVLFGGDSLAQWVTDTGEPAAWTVGDGFFEVTPNAGAILTRESFGDVQLHIEWASPSPAAGVGQDRGNSGVFLSILAFLNILILDFSDGFLGLWVSVHEEINDDIPRLVAGDIASELEDLTSEEPEAVSDGVLALVVRWDGDVNVVEG